MTRRAIDIKGKKLILEIQKNQHKTISINDARYFCGEENFVEIIKHLKYEGFIENCSQGYKLTTIGYRYHPRKAFFKKYRGYIVAAGIFYQH